MLKYYVKRSDGEVYQQVTTPPHENAWIHGEGVNEADLHLLAKTYDMDFNALRDVLDINELPRVEMHHESLYVFVRTAQRGKHGQVITTPLLLAVKGSVFANLSIATIANDKLAAPLSGQQTNTTSLLLDTFATVVSEYEELIQRTARYIFNTGHRLRTHEVKNEDFITFVTVEDNLNEYRMNLSGMLVVAERLRETLRDTDDKESIEDVLLYIRQLLVSIDSHNQTITSIRNAYGTIANNVLNQRMKTLTVLTVLIALPNVFYGMFGMNVLLPFTDEPWAYSAIVVFTIVVTFGVYILAKRFKVF
ncbi:MAG TPA: CorA family divalent cation transporter [Candidatus Saccharimonadales bacterium]|nr:CorA family divalent cation transporter [Candidatus Saccharimonadales bacterium]